MPVLIISFIVVLCLCATRSEAADVTVQSAATRSNLLELFTSEGCSSCPPAETWLSSLRQSPRLWKDIVPVAFHITYWDDLGWVDPLSAQAFTHRQRMYAAAWGADEVYTPAFVVNGKEWRARDLNVIQVSTAPVGVLSATFTPEGAARVIFHPAETGPTAWQAHAALLGIGVSSAVTAGENGGRTLVHDFVALDLEDADMTGETPAAVLHLPVQKAKSRPAAFAVWVTKAGSIEPIQATGGDLWNAAAAASLSKAQP